MEEQLTLAGRNDKIEKGISVISGLEICRFGKFRDNKGETEDRRVH